MDLTIANFLAVFSVALTIGVALQLIPELIKFLLDQ